MARKRDWMLGIEFGRYALARKRAMCARTEKRIRENPAIADEIAEIHVKAVREVDLIDVEGVTIGELTAAALAEEVELN